MSFLLPDTCETCGERLLDRLISSRHAKTEEAEYACGARYHQYRSHQAKTITKACPKTPTEQAKQVRRDQIDRAVAEVLNRLGVTYQECEEFPRRMERDKGWSLRAEEGIWCYLNAKRPERS